MLILGSSRKRILLSVPSFQTAKFVAKNFATCFCQSNFGLMGGKLMKPPTKKTQNKCLVGTGATQRFSLLRTDENVPMVPYQINSDFWPLTRHRQVLIWAKMAALWNSEPLAQAVCTSVMNPLTLAMWRNVKLWSAALQIGYDTKIMPSISTTKASVQYSILV